MRAIEAWTLGYLLNALWQAPVLFCAAWAMTLMARRAGPAIQHKLWVAALLAEAALPACPVRFAHAARALGERLLAWPIGSAGGIRIDFGPALGTVTGPRQLPATLLAVLLLVYGVSVAYFTARLIFGLRQTHTMRRRAEPLSLASSARRHEVRISREVAGPVTVGLWRGAVLLPEGFLERVTGDDLRAVLAHEGAHVERRDFLKNALYCLATALIAFHPALWLTRRQLTETREMVCDALAAQAVHGGEQYAESLLRLASLQMARTPDKMLHAIGIFGLFDANSFERRVMHLTANRTEIKGARRMMTVVACGVLGLGTCATALAMRVGVPQQSEAVSQPSGANTQLARVSGGAMAGNVLSKVAPVYPPDAKAEGISGAVVLSAVIGADGAIENLQVISGPEKLRTSSLDAVRQWTYKPYVLNGVAVPVQTTITVTYSFGR